MPVDDDYPRHGSMTWFGAADYGMDTGPSAVAIVDLVLQYLCPTSVVDVGCGTGVFLKEFEKRGTDTILGLDGPATKTVFRPDGSNFLAVDLTARVELGRRFDLALCLEVAEHLPAESANCLVETLTDLAPVVLFSAAHPAQGGQDHVNERWPVYWYRRFAQRGYVALDILRGPLSGRPRVLDCYRQNLVLYVESSRCTVILDRAAALNVPDALVLAYQEGVTTDLQHQPWGVLVRTLVRKLGRRIRRSTR
jgi:SAM-dependent methyltransferase